MVEPLPIQVEVDVQDYFFADPASSDSHLSADKSPITPGTWEQWFRQWLEYLQVELSPSRAYELSLRLTDDREIQSLNDQYRHKNQPTDVLAFASLEVDYPQIESMQTTLPLYLGDIVISVETADRQAVQQGHTLQQELAWLAAHALLHLLGWDHPDEDRLTEMLQMQESLLQIVGLTISYYQEDKSIQSPA